jgi:dTDP-4-amino-4,6-dideoxygalactose transaminase
MASTGIATSVHYPSLASHPLLGDTRRCTACADEDRRIVTLPSFPGLDTSAQYRVVAALAEALAQAGMHRSALAAE